MPPGLTLNPDGTWSGGVMESGTFALTVETCDPHGACADQVLMITVVSAVSLPPTDTAGDLESGSAFGDALILAGLVLISLALPRACLNAARGRGSSSLRRTRATERSSSPDPPGIEAAGGGDSGCCPDPRVEPGATLPASRRGPEGVTLHGHGASAGRCEPRGTGSVNVTREP